MVSFVPRTEYLCRVAAGGACPLTPLSGGETRECCVAVMAGGGAHLDLPETLAQIFSQE